jgi:uncharacterized protein (DUF2141 family)
MRALLLAGLLASVPIMAAAAEPPECVGEGPSRLLVDVTGVRSASGEVAVTLYPDDPSRFLAPGGKQARVRLPARAQVTQACFRLDRGAYAIAVYHDADGDRDFDRTIVGMPLEGFGFSNNPANLTALPDYDSVRTVVRGADQKLTIRLRYP